MELVVAVPPYQGSRPSWCVWSFLLFRAAVGICLLVLRSSERSFDSDLELSCTCVLQEVMEE